MEGPNSPTLSRTVQLSCILLLGTVPHRHFLRALDLGLLQLLLLLWQLRVGPVVLGHIYQGFGACKQEQLWILPLGS